MATRLRQLRERKGWTLKEAADASGVYPSYISAIETRRRSAGNETLQKLAETYAETESTASELYKEFLEMKADDSVRAEQRKNSIRLVLRNQGIFGEMIFKAISTLTAGNLDRSQFQIVKEPGEQQVFWDTRELGNSAVIRLGQKNYRVRIMVSEETELDPPD
ncbi:MAG: helix-turn-helix transcriptional regulator [Verrucomicrobiales bacterium]|nr:helix-turn-helix transcriptional regulator [Verrucomicrobiales bacterium]